jgi:hypothetical protein
MLVMVHDSGRSARMDALAVQSRSGAVRRWPIQASSAATGQTPGIGAVGPDRGALAGAVPVGLGATDGQQHAFVGHPFDVAEGEADEFGAAQAAPKPTSSVARWRAEGKGRGRTRRKHQPRAPGWG